MVLSEGYVLFHGEASMALEWFTTSLGYPCHPHSNPADYIIDLVNVSFNTKTSSSDSQDNIDFVLGPKMTTIQDVYEAHVKFDKSITNRHLKR